MPPVFKKNTKKKRGNGRGAREPRVRKIEDIAKAEEFESYGHVTKVFGNKRFQVEVNDTKGFRRVMTCSLKGSCRKRVDAGCYVLVVLYDFNENQGQIVDVYSDSEVIDLKKAKLWDFDNCKEEDNVSENDDEQQEEITESNSEDEDDIDNI